MTAADAQPIPEAFATGFHEVGPLEGRRNDKGHNSVTGWACYGSGQSDPQNNAMLSEDISRQYATTLVYTGPDETPAIHATGAFWTLADFGIRSDTGADCAIEVRHRGRFNGAKGLIDKVSVKGFGTAVRIGDPGKPGNDNTTIRQLHVADCDAAVEIVSMQAMRNAIDRLHARKTRAVISATGGGDVTLRNLECDLATTIFDVTGSGKSVGPNNSRFACYDGRADDTPGSLTLVRGSESAFIQAEFYGFVFPSRGVYAGVILPSDRQTVYIDKAINFPARFSVRGAGRVVVRDTELKSLPPDWGKVGRVELRNCTYRGGTISGVW